MDRVHCSGDVNFVDGGMVSRRKESASVSGRDLYRSLEAVCFCLTTRLSWVAFMPDIIMVLYVFVTWKQPRAPL